MRALVLNGAGIGGLAFVDRPVPSPGPGQAVVRLAAAALNHRDLWACRGWSPGKPQVVLGSDGAGIVETIGGEAGDLQPGTKVVINPGLNWASDETAPGADFEILGDPTDGTFAERVLVPIRNLFPKPPHLGWEAAAALPLSGLTSYRALVTKAAVGPGTTVVIVGAGGGTASLCLILAKALGARAIITSRHQEKRARALALGADLALDSAGPWGEEVRKFTAGRGADAVIENVGRPTWEQSLSALARGGRLVVYGSTAGDLVETDLVPFFLGWRSILGTTMGSGREFRAMLELVAHRRLAPPIDRVFRFTDAMAAFEHLDRGEQFGKVVLRMGGSLDQPALG